MMLNDFFDKKFTYAIIGASKNENKYGFKILETLINKKFKVIPINPKENEILGIKCYKNLSEIIDEIDVVNFVVPPNISLKILESLNENKKIWFQPGSYNEECIEFCEKNKIKYIKDFCLMEKVKEN